MLHDRLGVRNIYGFNPIHTIKLNLFGVRNVFVTPLGPLKPALPGRPAPPGAPLKYCSTEDQIKD